MNLWDEHVVPALSRLDVAGALGALCSLRWAPGATYLQRFTGVLISAIAVYYCGPPMANGLGLPGGWPFVFVFVLGTVALNILSKIVAAVSSLRVSEVRAFLLTLLKGGK